MQNKRNSPSSAQSNASLIEEIQDIAKKMDAENRRVISHETDVFLKKYAATLKNLIT